jgi:GT2 family glycosyltransferase
MNDVTVVTVTYNSARVLPGFLAALPAALADVERSEIVVADNASHDDSVDLAERSGLGVHVVQTGRNAGYAGAFNAAVAAAAPTRSFLLVNPDVRLGPGAVAALMRALTLPDTGIAVPRLEDEDGSLLPSQRREPTVLRALGEAVLGGTTAGRWPLLGELIVKPSAYDHPAAVAWASGAAMLISSECLRTVGAWDESFFLYSEETEFALRARDHGWLCRYTPDARATHLGGEAHTAPWLYSLLTRNRAELYRRRHTRVSTAAFRGVLLLGESLRAAAGRPTSRAAVRALLSRPPLQGEGERQRAGGWGSHPGTAR